MYNLGILFEFLANLLSLFYADFFAFIDGNYERILILFLDLLLRLLDSIKVGGVTAGVLTHATLFIVVDTGISLEAFVILLEGVFKAHELYLIYRQFPVGPLVSYGLCRGNGFL